MAQGTKVGDAYIEVRPQLNDKGFQRQVERSIKRTEAAWAKSSTAQADNWVRDQSRAMRSIEVQKTTMLRKMEARQRKQLQRNTQVEKAAIEDVERAHSRSLTRRMRSNRQAIDEISKLQNRLDLQRPARAPKEAPEDKGPRRGSNNRGNPVTNLLRNVLSILPGQLEKVFENPIIAGAVVAAGVSLAALFTTAFGGALGAAAGALGVGFATAFMISADPAFKALAEKSGKTLKSSLKTQLDPIRENLAQMFLSGVMAINNVIKGIDVGPLADIANQMGSLFTQMGPWVSQIANRLLLIGSQVFPVISEGVLDLLSAFDGFLIAVQKNMPAVKSAISDFITFVYLGISAMTKLVELFGAMYRNAQLISAIVPILGSQIATFFQGLVGPGTALGSVLGLLGIKFKEISAGSAEMQSLGAASMSALNQAALAAANGGMSVLGKATNTVTDEQRALNDAVSAYNRNIYNTLTAQLDFADAQADLSKRLKDSNNNLKISTATGRQNLRVIANMVDSAFQQAAALKESGASAATANARFSELVGEIKGTGGASAATKKKVDELAKKYQKFSDADDVTKKVKVEVEGLDPARAQLASLGGTTIHTVRVTVNRTTNDFTGVKGQANGGPVVGPGTATSDSVPRMLSNGEYVIKASAVRKVGTGFLDQINQGERLEGLARGGPAKRGKAPKGPTTAQRAMGREYLRLTNMLGVLTESIERQTAAHEKFSQNLSQIQSSFDQFTNLSALQTEGKTAGDLVNELLRRRKTEDQFASTVLALKKRGLGAEGVQQLLEAGPESPLAKMLRNASKFDLKLINKALADTKMPAAIARAMDPNAIKNAKRLAANRRRATAITDRINDLELKNAQDFAPKAKNVRTVLFSRQQMADLGFRQGQVVRVMIDGKEIRAIVRQENTKTSKRQSTSIRRGR